MKWLVWAIALVMLAGAAVLARVVFVEGPVEVDLGIVQLEADRGFVVGENLEYCNKGLGAQQAKNHDLAIEYFTRCIDTGGLSQGDLAVAHNQRGLSYRNKGQYDRAIADYDSAIRLKPDFAKAYNNLAWILATAPTASTRNGARAVELALRAVALRDVANSRGTLAAAYAEAGRFGDAVRAQERAIAKARDEGKSDLTAWQDRLRLYRNGRAYRQQ